MRTLNELKQLSKDFRSLGQRRPGLARLLGVTVIGLGLFGAMALGPWRERWYPILFLGCLGLIAIGAAALIGPQNQVPGIEPFLEAVARSVLPFSVCLGCPRLLANEGRCTECTRPELFEARSEIDRRMVLTRVRSEHPTRYALE